MVFVINEVVTSKELKNPNPQARTTGKKLGPKEVLGESGKLVVK